jgi:hypothetical protein
LNRNRGEQGQNRNLARHLGSKGQRQSWSRHPPTNTQAPPTILLSRSPLHSPPRSAPSPSEDLGSGDAPRIPDLAAISLSLNAISSRVPAVACWFDSLRPWVVAMVSGGSVGTEGEGDPAAAVERDEVVLAPARELVVGYALTSKKAKSFLQPKLRGLAR